MIIDATERLNRILCCSIDEDIALYLLFFSYIVVRRLAATFQFDISGTSDLLD